jgi:hypothetical protein
MGNSGMGTVCCPGGGCCSSAFPVCCPDGCWPAGTVCCAGGCCSSFGSVSTQSAFSDGREQGKLPITFASLPARQVSGA